MSPKSLISSHVRISYRFYQFVTTRYTTDFYIIKVIPFSERFKRNYIYQLFTEVEVDSAGYLPSRKATLRCIIEKASGKRDK